MESSSSFFISFRCFFFLVYISNDENTVPTPIFQPNPGWTCVLQASPALSLPHSELYSLPNLPLSSSLKRECVCPVEPRLTLFRSLPLLATPFSSGIDLFQTLAPLSVLPFSPSSIYLPANSPHPFPQKRKLSPPPFLPPQCIKLETFVGHVKLFSSHRYQLEEVLPPFVLPRVGLAVSPVPSYTHRTDYDFPLPYPIHVKELSQRGHINTF